MRRIVRAGRAPAPLDVVRATRPQRFVGGWLLAAVLAAPVQPAPAQGPAPASVPLSMAEALRLAAAESPRLSAQRLAVGAADASVVPASQLPDPKLSLGIDNLPADGPDRFSLTRDFMTMRRIGVMQDFPREAKRRLRGEKAQAEADKERAVLAALSVNVRRDVALAWLDTYFAQAQGRTLSELVPEAELVNQVAQALLAGGKGAAADPIAARAAAIALEDRIAEARRNVKRAQAALARWVGASHAYRPLEPAPDLTVLAQPPAELLAGIDHHPELASYGPMESMARAEAGLARAARTPDWSLELAYSQRGPAFSNMLSVAVRVDLPLWGATRQDPLILARERQLAQVQASREDARRLREAELRAQVADWETAKERVARIETQLVPLARQRFAATLAAYRGGRGDVNAVLTARSNEIEARLALIQQQAELGRAWAGLNFLLDSHEEPSGRDGK